MSRYEEELQNKIESGARLDENDPDVQAFRSVFRALSETTEEGLSKGFADRVVATLTETHREKYSRDYIWFGAGILTLMAVFIGTFFYLGYKIDLGFLNEISDYAMPFVFCLGFVSFLHWLDKRFLQKKKMFV